MNSFSSHGIKGSIYINAKVRPGITDALSVQLNPRSALPYINVQLSKKGASNPDGDYVGWEATDLYLRRQDAERLRDALTQALAEHDQQYPQTPTPAEPEQATEEVTT